MVIRDYRSITDGKENPDEGLSRDGDHFLTLRLTEASTIKLPLSRLSQAIHSIVVSVRVMKRSSPPGQCFPCVMRHNTCDASLLHTSAGSWVGAGWERRMITYCMGEMNGPDYHPLFQQ